MNEIAKGKCQICGKENATLHRKYYYYNIKCNCHSPKHFEIVEYCDDCKPVEPTETKVYLNTETLNKED